MPYVFNIFLNFLQKRIKLFLIPFLLLNLVNSSVSSPTNAPIIIKETLDLDKPFTAQFNVQAQSAAPETYDLSLEFYGQAGNKKYPLTLPKTLHHLVYVIDYKDDKNALQTFLFEAKIDQDNVWLLSLISNLGTRFNLQNGTELWGTLTCGIPEKEHGVIHVNDSFLYINALALNVANASIKAKYITADVNKFLFGSPITEIVKFERDISGYKIAHSYPFELSNGASLIADKNLTLHSDYTYLNAGTIECNELFLMPSDILDAMNGYREIKADDKIMLESFRNTAAQVKVHSNAWINVKKMGSFEKIEILSSRAQYKYNEDTMLDISYCYFLPASPRPLMEVTELYSCIEEIEQYLIDQTFEEKQKEFNGVYLGGLSYKTNNYHTNFPSRPAKAPNLHFHVRNTVETVKSYSVPKPQPERDSGFSWGGKSYSSPSHALAHINANYASNQLKYQTTSLSTAQMQQYQKDIHTATIMDLSRPGVPNVFKAVGVGLMGLQEIQRRHQENVQRAMDQYKDSQAFATITGNRAIELKTLSAATLKNLSRSLFPSSEPNTLEAMDNPKQRARKKLSDFAKAETSVSQSEATAEDIQAYFQSRWTRPSQLFTAHADCDTDSEAEQLPYGKDRAKIIKTAGKLISDSIPDCVAERYGSMNGYIEHCIKDADYQQVLSDTPLTNAERFKIAEQARQRYSLVMGGLQFLEMAVDIIPIAVEKSLRAVGVDRGVARVTKWAVSDGLMFVTGGAYGATKGAAKAGSALGKGARAAKAIGKAIKLEAFLEQSRALRALTLEALSPKAHKIVMIEACMRDVEAFSNLPIPRHQAKELRKAMKSETFIELSKEKKIEHRAKFDSEKTKLKAEWAKETDQTWPTYAEDIPSKSKKSKKKYFKRAGEDFDAHEIIPNSYNSPLKWWNIHPVKGGANHQGGIHGTGSALNKMLDKIKQ